MAERMAAMRVDKVCVTLNYDNDDANSYFVPKDVGC